VDDRRDRRNRWRWQGRHRASPPRRTALRLQDERARDRIVPAAGHPRHGVERLLRSTSLCREDQSALKRDPEKAWPRLDPGWGPVLVKKPALGLDPTDHALPIT